MAIHTCLVTYIQLIQLRLSSEGQKSKPQNLDLQARKAFWDIN
jgi:hypothetical protein